MKGSDDERVEVMWMVGWNGRIEEQRRTKKTWEVHLFHSIFHPILLFFIPTPHAYFIHISQQGLPLAQWQMLGWAHMMRREHFFFFFILRCFSLLILLLYIFSSLSFQECNLPVRFHFLFIDF